MDVKEKLKLLRDYCNSRACNGCEYDKDKSWCDERSSSELTEDELNEIIKNLKLIPAVEVADIEVITPTEDIVNHPSHYTHGGMECIDEMVMVFGKEVVQHFCVCNVWKYRKRALFKNGEEDLKKSDWYLQKFKELIGQ